MAATGSKYMVTKNKVAYPTFCEKGLILESIKHPEVRFHVQGNLQNLIQPGEILERDLDFEVIDRKRFNSNSPSPTITTIGEIFGGESNWEKSKQTDNSWTYLISKFDGTQENINEKDIEPLQTAEVLRTPALIENRAWVRLQRMIEKKWAKPNATPENAESLVEYLKKFLKPNETLLKDKLQ